MLVSFILIFLVKYTNIPCGHLKIKHYTDLAGVRFSFLYLCCSVWLVLCQHSYYVRSSSHLIYIWAIFVHTDLSCRWRGDDDEMRTKKVCWVLDMDIIGTIPNLLINYEHIPGLETVSPVNVQIRTHVTDQRQSVI